MCKACNLAQEMADLASAKGYNSDMLVKACVRITAAAISANSKGSDVQAAVFIEFISEKLTDMVAAMMQGAQEDIDRATNQANDMLDKVVNANRRLH